MLAGGDEAEFQRLVAEAALRPELRDAMGSLRPPSGGIAGRVDAGMRRVYDARMRVTGQNGISDYDAGFTNFLYTFETSATAGKRRRRRARCIVARRRRPPDMRLGIALPRMEGGGQPLGAASLTDAARRIEEAGFDSAWVFDSLGRGRLLPDPLTALAVAGTVTRTIELGTGVLQVPLRRPMELAHRVLTTHLVCGGRLRLGVGAGSTAEDFAAVGVDFASRFRQLDASLGIMRKLWTGGRVGEAELGAPWPVAAGGPPILIGSWAGSRWIERAAKEFDGWVASGARSSWRLIAEGIARFRATRRQAGRPHQRERAPGDREAEPGRTGRSLRSHRAALRGGRAPAAPQDAGLRRRGAGVGAARRCPSQGAPRARVTPARRSASPRAWGSSASC